MKGLELELDKFKELYFKAISKNKDLIQENIKLKEINLKLLKKENVGRKPYSDEVNIKLMFDMYLNNYSFNDVAEFLNENNIKTKKGGCWYKSSVAFILKNNLHILNDDEKIIFFKNLKRKNRNDLVP